MLQAEEEKNIPIHSKSSTTKQQSVKNFSDSTIAFNSRPLCTADFPYLHLKIIYFSIYFFNLYFLCFSFFCYRFMSFFFIIQRNVFFLRENIIFNSKTYFTSYNFFFFFYIIFVSYKL